MLAICFNFAGFHDKKEFSCMSLWTSTFVKFNERNFLFNLIENITGISRSKSIKGFLIKKYRNQFNLLEPVDNFHEL